MHLAAAKLSKPILTADVMQAKAMMEVIMAEREVWGFTVKESAVGKNIWPNGLKLEACRRIRED